MEVYHEISDLSDKLVSLYRTIFAVNSHRAFFWFNISSQVKKSFYSKVICERSKVNEKHSIWRMEFLFIGIFWILLTIIWYVPLELLWKSPWGDNLDFSCKGLICKVSPIVHRAQWGLSSSKRVVDWCLLSRTVLLVFFFIANGDERDSQAFVFSTIFNGIEMSLRWTFTSVVFVEG